MTRKFFDIDLLILSINWVPQFKLRLTLNFLSKFKVDFTNIEIKLYVILWFSNSSEKFWIQSFQEYFKDVGVFFEKTVTNNYFWKMNWLNGKKQQSISISFPPPSFFHKNVFRKKKTSLPSIGKFVTVFQSLGLNLICWNEQWKRKENSQPKADRHFFNNFFYRLAKNKMFRGFVLTFYFFQIN